MAVVFTEFVQLGYHAPFYRRFEETLIQMAQHIGSLAPELKGGQIHHEGHDVTWLVVCTIERPLTPYIAYDVIESDLESGFLRVMQLAIARLAHLFCDEFEGTPYSRSEERRVGKECRL